jgi:hypothetical protein
MKSDVIGVTGGGFWALAVVAVKMSSETKG